MANVNELIIQISAELGDTQKKLQDVEKQVIKLGKSTEEAGKDTSKSFINLSNVAETALGFGLAGAAAKAADAVRQFVVDGVKDAMRMEEAMQSLAIQTTGSTSKLIADMKEATGGLVSTLSLVESANRALSLGVKEEMLPTMASLANSIAKIQGLDPDATFTQVANAVGKLSPKLLVNLGIIIDETRAYTDYAKAHDTVVEALDEETKKTIVLNEAYKQQEAIIIQQQIATESLADSVQKGKVAWQEFKDFIGGALATDLAFIAETFKDLPIWVKNQSEEWVKVNGELNQVGDSLKPLHEELDKINKEIVGAQENLKKLFSGGSTQKSDEIDAKIADLKYQQDQLKNLKTTYGKDKDGNITATPGSGTIEDYAGTQIQVTNAQQTFLDLNKQIADLEKQKTSELVAQEAIQKNYQLNAQKTGQIENTWIANNAKELRTKIKNEQDYLATARNTYDVLKPIEDDRLAKAKDLLKQQKDIEQSLIRQRDMYIQQHYLENGGDPVMALIAAKKAISQATKDVNADIGSNVNQGAQNDFIIRPGQSAVPFSSADTIVGLKNTAMLGGSNGTVINVNIESLSGIDATQIAEQLRVQLFDLIQY